VQINGQIYKQTRGSAVILPDKRNIYIVIRRIPTKTKTAMAHELTKSFFTWGKKERKTSNNSVVALFSHKVFAFSGKIPSSYFC